MVLLWLIIIPLLGGLAALGAAPRSRPLARWICFAGLAAGGLLAVIAWAASSASAGPWRLEMRWAWIPQLGISLHLGMDGLSFLLVLLTYFVGIIALLSSWTEIETGEGFFLFNLMWILAGIVGVFVALDLFLFYLAWEVMLIPMYFLISIWGHERRTYAAIKFFIFTQISGLLLLLAIVALYFTHGAATGIYTFDYPALPGTPMGPTAARWMMLGFFIAFAVKLPMFPVHPWLPDAHTEAPTAGSIILASLMLKTGGYGLLRFVIPLFPDAAREIAPVAMILGVAGILYGAILAFAQTDLKRLVAYTSVSHLGFVLLGAFAMNELALQGAVVTMIAHGLSTGALFFIAGALQHRLHTREMASMGGVWSIAPTLSGAALAFTMASAGLPGLADFVGEFLTLLGTWQASPPLAVAAALGILGATIYGLKLLHQTFFGPNRHGLSFPDLSGREVVIVGSLVASLVCFGLYPGWLIETAAPSLRLIQQTTVAASIEQEVQP